MERITLQVGTFEVNCSILVEDGNAWIVDPGQEAHRIIDLLREKHLTPQAILLTHVHFDHFGAIPALQTAYPKLPVYVHPDDVPAFTHPMNQLPPDYPAVDVPQNLRTDMPVALQSSPLTVIPTPGHTPGGVCYYLPDSKLLLSGDTLFAGSVGRTDLPGGDMATLMRSLVALKTLPPDTTVIPGHGPFTTIANERAGNPFLQ